MRSQTKEADYIVSYDLNNRGGGPTRNSALEFVKTPWVGFLDDDDIVDPHYAEWLAEEVEDNDLVVFHMKFLSRVGNIKAGQIIPRPEYPKLCRGNVGISFAMKTSLLRATPFKRKGAPGCMHEDWCMIKAVQQQGCKIKVSDRLAYYARPQ